MVKTQSQCPPSIREGVISWPKILLNFSYVHFITYTLWSLSDAENDSEVKIYVTAMLFVLKSVIFLFLKHGLAYGSSDFAL